MFGSRCVFGFQKAPVRRLGMISLGGVCGAPPLVHAPTGLRPLRRCRRNGTGAGPPEAGRRNRSLGVRKKRKWKREGRINAFFGGSRPGRDRFRPWILRPFRHD